MIFPSKEAFLEKAKLGNLVPVYREILADQDTPVSVYDRLRRARLVKSKGRASGGHQDGPLTLQSRVQ